VCKTKVGYRVYPMYRTKVLDRVQPMCRTKVVNEVYPICVELIKVGYRLEPI